MVAAHFPWEPVAWIHERQFLDKADISLPKASSDLLDLASSLEEGQAIPWQQAPQEVDGLRGAWPTLPIRSPSCSTREYNAYNDCAGSL